MFVRFRAPGATPPARSQLVLAGWLPIEVTRRMSDEVVESTLRRFLTLVDDPDWVAQHHDR